MQALTNTLYRGDMHKFTPLFANGSTGTPEQRLGHIAHVNLDSGPAVHFGGIESNAPSPKDTLFINPPMFPQQSAATLDYRVRV